jgi:hypothetical protein
VIDDIVGITGDVPGKLEITVVIPGTLVSTADTFEVPTDVRTGFRV